MHGDRAGAKAGSESFPSLRSVLRRTSRFRSAEVTASTSWRSRDIGPFKTTAAPGTNAARTRNDVRLARGRLGASRSRSGTRRAGGSDRGDGRSAPSAPRERPTLLEALLQRTRVGDPKRSRPRSAVEQAHSESRKQRQPQTDVRRRSGSGSCAAVTAATAGPPRSSGPADVRPPTPPTTRRWMQRPPRLQRAPPQPGRLAFARCGRSHRHPGRRPAAPANRPRCRRRRRRSGSGSGSG